MKIHQMLIINFTPSQTITQMNNALIYIMIGAIFDTFGDVLMKNWVVHSNKTYFIAGMCFYIIGLSFLAYSFTFKKIVVASVVFLVLNLLFLSLVNWFYFSESLNSKEIVAIGFGIIAVALFEIN